MTNNVPFIVQAVETSGPGDRWQPHEGPETRDFLDYVVPEDSRENVCGAAASILGRGISPQHEAGTETGLVVGYVQSGKTMSFETAAALARDNGFQMVILVAGASNPLLEQSTSRVRRDFRLDDSSRARRWIHFQNPENDDSTIQTLRDVFEDWRDEGTPAEYKMTVLVTVLKHFRRISNLTALVESVSLRGVPVLIIDDEADQASLNTEVAQGEESTTYRCLMALRDALPLHTYLQYTATPQAPLLISIVDSLSPNFVEVLTPGGAYVGGCDFFGDNQDLVRTIPSGDVPTNANPLPEPPDSLLEALRIFMVGVAIGLFQDGNRGNRSMLVHPSHRTIQHQEYYNWLRGIFEEWKSILGLRDTDPDKQDLIEELRVAYDDLAETAQNGLPTFDQLAPTFRFAFRRTRLLEVNARAGRTPEVDWGSAYGWILVGGQAMDRGFTVEGLTVTYMPRGIGVGNADTVQQRARFFGYKRDYLGLCRVYLEQGTHSAFERYVQHEEDMRGQLEEIRDSGQSLNDWKRAFVLDNALRPCRNSVLEFDYIRGRFSDEWVAPRVVQATDAVLGANQQTVTRFITETSFANQEGHPDRTDTQRHDVASGLRLNNVMHRLLIPMRIPSSRDSQRMTGLLLQLSKALEANPNELCTVYRMSPLTGRERGIDSSGEVTNLFQGKAPVSPRERQGEVYPGDQAIRENQDVSVQIHMLDLTRDGKVVQRDVPVLAVWVPARLAIGWIEQDQPKID
ncbi:MAG: alpha-1,4 polygalactosaminidase [Chloroflexota bacterium]|nr:alpha-1,4 polygalactosaminidase [Chloroflexota bacterium]